MKNAPVVASGTGDRQKTPDRKSLRHLYQRCAIALLGGTASFAILAVAASDGMAQTSYLEPGVYGGSRADQATGYGHYQRVAPRAYSSDRATGPRFGTATPPRQSNYAPQYRSLSAGRAEGYYHAPDFSTIPTGQSWPNRTMHKAGRAFSSPLIEPRQYVPGNYNVPVTPTAGAPSLVLGAGGTPKPAPARSPKSRLEVTTGTGLDSSSTVITPYSVQRPAGELFHPQGLSPFPGAPMAAPGQMPVSTFSHDGVLRQNGVTVISSDTLRAAGLPVTASASATSTPKPASNTAKPRPRKPAPVATSPAPARKAEPPKPAPVKTEPPKPVREIAAAPEKKPDVTPPEEPDVREPVTIAEQTPTPTTAPAPAPAPEDTRLETVTEPEAATPPAKVDLPMSLPVPASEQTGTSLAESPVESITPPAAREDTVPAAETSTNSGNEATLALGGGDNESSEEAAASGETSIAALPAEDAVAAASGSNDGGRVLFGQDDADLTPEARNILTGIAARYAGSENVRLLLKAYAAGSEEEATRARRLSLSRALAVRAFLIENNVRSTRIDVRAFGNQDSGSPADRVDIEIQ